MLQNSPTVRSCWLHIVSSMGFDCMGVVPTIVRSYLLLVPSGHALVMQAHFRFIGGHALVMQAHLGSCVVGYPAPYVLPDVGRVASRGFVCVDTHVRNSSPFEGVCS